METADGTAGDGDAEEGEDGEPLGVVAGEGVIRNLWHPTILGEETYAHAHGHDQQCCAEDGVEAADEGVNGQQRGQHTVEEHQSDPYPFPGGIVKAPGIAGHCRQQACGGGHEDGAHEHEQYEAEHAHTQSRRAAQLIADHLR